MISLVFLSRSLIKRISRWRCVCERCGTASSYSAVTPHSDAARHTCQVLSNGAGAADARMTEPPADPPWTPEVHKEEFCEVRREKGSGHWFV
jgi:hypothetical protein